MQDLKTFNRELSRIYNILDIRQRVQMVGMFLVILVGSLFELLGVSAILPFIQSIMEPEKLLEKAYIRVICDALGISSTDEVVILVGAGIIVIYIIKNAYLSFSAYLQAAYSNNTQKDLSILMLHSYMNQPYSFFVSAGSSVVLQGVNSDVTGVYQVILNGFKLLSEVLVVISVSIYLVATDWVLAVGVLMVGFLCLFFVVFGLKRKISQMSAVSRTAGALRYKWLLQASGGIKDILVYCRQNYFLNGFRRASEDACRSATGFAFVGALPERIIEAFCISGIVATVLIRLKMGVNIDDFVPKMGVFAMGAFRLLPSISRSTGYINAFVFYRQYVDAAYENIVGSRNVLQEWSNKEKSQVAVSTTTTEAITFQSCIFVNNIKWRYKDGEDLILNGVSLKIHKGEVVGIIGESGSGKSTFADILLQLYHPQEGEILMDGVDIELIPQAWSMIIGYVPQSVFLIDDTIRNNVVFGADSADDTMVWSVLKKASLDTFVKNLTDGLDTIVGERGVKFSGGQRQRIAIARALYANPQILILDEATSALDSETEEAVMEAIDALAGKITLVIIAHRLTTLKGCNKIYEIVDGKAVEKDRQEVVND